jgi:hypothetical protein
VVLVVIALAANPAAKEGMIGKDCSRSGSAEDGVLQGVECCITVKKKDNELAAGAKPAATEVRDATIRPRGNFILCGLDSQVDNRNSKLL